MDKLHFLTAGLPLSSKNYKEGLDIINKLDLDGLEIEFVHGVRMTEQNQKLVKNFSLIDGKKITCHGPYYINLNSLEEDKINSSITRILETAEMGNSLGAYSITFHAAFYMKINPESVFKTVYSSMEKICSILENNNNHIWIRPETTGKATQWGTLEEIVQLSKNFKQILPCIDFAHIHARNNGLFNTYDEFSKIFEYIGNELGNDILQEMHMHLAGIEYSQKGEKNHLILEESDMNYKDLLKAIKKFDIKGVLVCESPNIEDDTKLLKDYYKSI